MKRYTLHFNSECADCAKLGEWNRRLDWLGRFNRTTAPSILGTPVVGDVHIVDHESSRVFSGAYATQVVCQNIPAYWVMALLMKLPFVFQRMARQKPGCNGDMCAIK